MLARVKERRFFQIQEGIFFGMNKISDQLQKE
jgi:hypothetical protein